MYKKCGCYLCKGLGTLTVDADGVFKLVHNKTREDWVSIYEDSIEALKPSDLTTEEYLSGVSSTMRGPSSKKEKPPADFYSPEELRAMGIECGEGSMVHRQNIIVGKNLKIGKNTRIDGYCTISTGAGITIGDSVHIAGYVSLMGGAGIEIGDYCSIASGSKIFSVSDDVVGRGGVGPQVPLEKRHLHKGKVIMEPHSVLAIGAVMMPGSLLSKGSTVMSNSIYLNKEQHDNYNVYAGTPAVYIKDKKPEFTKLVEETENE